MSINAQFGSDLYDFFEVAKSTAQAISKEVLLEVGKRLVDYSPIGNPPEWKKPYWPKGYIPGHFINNWQVGIDEEPEGVIEAIDGSGQGSLERLSHLGRWTIGHQYYFVNNLPYAEVLELGTWSLQVGPMGMIGRVEMEFDDIVNKAFNTVIANQKWAFKGI